MRKVKDHRAKHGRSAAEAPQARLRAAILTEFMAHVDPTVEAAYAAIRQLPGYRELGPSESKDVLRSLRWIVVTLADCLRNERALKAREIERLHGIGAAHARWGVPLSDFQRAFSTGLDHAFDSLREIARELDDHGSGADTIVRDLSGRLTDAVSAREDGFARMSGSPMSPEGAEQATFVESVLDEGVPEPRLERMATVLGLGGAKVHTLLVAVTRSGAEADLYAVAHESVPGLGAGAPWALRTNPHPHAVVLRGGPLDEDGLSLLARAASAHRIVWTTASDERWTRLGARYRRLRPLMHVAGVVGGESGVMDLDDLAHYEALSYTPLSVARSLCARYLGPVFAQPPREARAWLSVFEELHRCHWVVADAAKRLNMHPNTLYRRLERFAELTGMDSRTSQGRLLVLQAVHLWHLHGEAMPALGDSGWS